MHIPTGEKKKTGTTILNRRAVCMFVLLGGGRIVDGVGATYFSVAATGGSTGGTIPSTGSMAAPPTLRRPHGRARPRRRSWGSTYYFMFC
jgi:hypothetical protein